MSKTSSNRKILLIDIDRIASKQNTLPNLPLMKLSRYHKKLGDKICLNKCDDPDILYISCVFTWHRAYAFQVKKMYESLGVKVEVGGSGVDIKKELPYEVEHFKPDYNLYKIDYSMGFTSRGCIRRCPWCIVPKKEGYIKDHAPLEEFLDPRFDKLILLDNNFLASPNWEKNLREIIARRLKVNFNQGLDIRLIDRYNAKLLYKTRFYNHNFNHRQLHFAWDLPQIEDQVMKGIKILFDVGFKPWNLMFYVLVGYNTSFEEDMYRVKKLIQLRIDPFVMIYRDFSGKPQRINPILKHFARWVNKRIYKVEPDFTRYKPILMRLGG